MKKLQLLAFAVALSGAAPLMAQPAAGDWELELGGAAWSNNDFENGAFSVTGSLGYYYTDNLEVALRQNIGFDASGHEDNQQWRGFTAVAVDWNFQLGGKLVPFVGANVGWSYAEDRDDTFFAAPEVGVKYYIHEKTYLFARGEYQWFFEDVKDADNNADNGNFLLTIGIGFNFGGAR